jgi:hypothetical protein
VKNTIIDDLACETTSSAEDIARMGQLLLNRGSYGDAGKGGIPEGKTLLSRNTIGHGAASNAILRVDLDNEVVVSQVRNTAGPRYQGYFVKFLKAIYDSIIKE